MAGIFDVLKQSGAIPLDELKLRSTGSDEDVEKRVQELVSEGLVSVEERSVDPTEAPQKVVDLTRKGLRSAIKG